MTYKIRRSHERKFFDHGWFLRGKVRTKAINPQQLDEFTKGIPLKRFANPSKIAESAIFLASPKAN